MKKFEYNRHYFKKSRQQSIQLLNNLIFLLGDIITTSDHFDNPSYPEKPEQFEQVIDVIANSYEKKYDVQKDHKSIDTIPTICKIFFRSNSDQSEKQLNKKYPNKDSIDYFSRMIVHIDINYDIDGSS